MGFYWVKWLNKLSASVNILELFPGWPSKVSGAEALVLIYQFLHIFHPLKHFLQQRSNHKWALEVIFFSSYFSSRSFGLSGIKIMDLPHFSYLWMCAQATEVDMVFGEITEVWKKKSTTATLAVVADTDWVKIYSDWSFLPHDGYGLFSSIEGGSTDH